MSETFPPMRAVVARLTVASLFVHAAVAQAEERMSEVQVTAGRVQRTTLDVAPAVTVVDTSSQAVPVPQISVDYLRGQNGIFVQQTTPGQGVPIVRGLKGSEVLHLVDGMRLNNAFFRNSPNQYVALVDSLNIERIEVVRGAASTLYGSDAMGGVVQFVTRRPRFDTDEWTGEGEARAVIATAEQSALTRVAGAIGKEGLSVSGGLSYQDHGSRRTGDGLRLDPSGYRAWAADAGVWFAPDDNREWSFGVQHLQQPRTPRVDELVAGFGQTEPASETFNFEPNSRLFAHGRHRRISPTPFITELELNVAYQRIDDDRRTRDTGASFEQRERNSSELYGLTAQARSEAGDRHQLVYGAEYYHDTVASERIRRDVTTGVATAATSRFPAGSTLASLAFYLQDEFAISPRWRLNAGLRYTLSDVELAEADRGVGADVDIDDLTGNFGLLYRLRAGINLTFNAGRAFRVPNIFDLGTLGPRPGNRFNIANPALQPETVYSYDLGLKLARGDLHAEIIAWRSDYQDKITSVPTGDLDVSGRTIVQGRNSDEVELWGWELGFSYALTERLGLGGNINYVRGEETSAGGSVQPGDRIPPLNGRLTVDYDLSPALGLVFEGRFAAAQERLSDRDIGDPRIDPVGTPGWGIANVRIGWQINPSLELSAGIENLLDQQYREHGSGLDGPGRGVTLAVTAGF